MFLSRSKAALGDECDWKRRRLLRAVHCTVEDGFDASWAIRNHVGNGHDTTGIDLIPAILRLSAFIERLKSIGWLDPRRWDEQEDTLAKAVLRYHGYACLGHGSSSC